MKEMRSRARWLKITVSAYGPSGGSRTDCCAKESFRSRTRRAGSNQPVFGRGIASSLRSCYVQEFRGFFVSLSLLSLCFVIIIKYSRTQRGTQATYPHPYSSLLLQGLTAIWSDQVSSFSKCSILLSKNPPKPSLNGNSSPNGLGHSLMLGVNSLLHVVGVSV